MIYFLVGVAAYAFGCFISSLAVVDLYKDGWAFLLKFIAIGWFYAIAFIVNDYIILPVVRRVTRLYISACKIAGRLFR